ARFIFEASHPIIMGPDYNSRDITDAFSEPSDFKEYPEILGHVSNPNTPMNHTYRIYKFDREIVDRFLEGRPNVRRIADLWVYDINGCYLFDDRKNEIVFTSDFRTVDEIARLHHMEPEKRIAIITPRFI
ncbi:hypothetical protein JXB31_01870, partial [Candidatus Woesearchaeota archaeon]|nr:hypothetical protein [Candidatus Woesearchaeota archaeon]